jgi:hypothetical protein
MFEYFGKFKERSSGNRETGKQGKRGNRGNRVTGKQGNGVYGFMGKINSLDSSYSLLDTISFI